MFCPVACCLSTISRLSAYKRSQVHPSLCTSLIDSSILSFLCLCMMASSAILWALLVLVVDLICAAATSTGALLPQEVYWKTVLPRTPMPTILQYLLHAGEKARGDGSSVGQIPYRWGGDGSSVGQIPYRWGGDGSSVGQIPYRWGGDGSLVGQIPYRWGGDGSSVEQIPFRWGGDGSSVGQMPFRWGGDGSSVEQIPYRWGGDGSSVEQIPYRWGGDGSSVEQIPYRWGGDGSLKQIPYRWGGDGSSVQQIPHSSGGHGASIEQIPHRWGGDGSLKQIPYRWGGDGSSVDQIPYRWGGDGSTDSGGHKDLSSSSKWKHDGTLHKHATNVDYILYRDLHPGWKQTLHVLKTTARSAFLTRNEADSLPFSSSALPNILSYFSVNPDSHEAMLIKSLLEICEKPADVGETILCATSLESMVEFAITMLGTFDIKATTSRAIKGTSTKEQPYTIVGVRRMGGSKSVVCHPAMYPYAVYYCHITEETPAFKVLAKGEDGTLVDAVVMCHMNTTRTDPKHPSFKATNSKPGVAMCHFNPRDNIIYTSSEETMQGKNGGAALVRDA